MMKVISFECGRGEFPMNIRRRGPSRAQVRAITYLIAALLIGGVFLWQTVNLMGAVKRTYSYLCSAMDVVFAQEA